MPTTASLPALDDVDVTSDEGADKDDQGSDDTFG